MRRGVNVCLLKEGGVVDHGVGEYPAVQHRQLLAAVGLDSSTPNAIRHQVFLVLPPFSFLHLLFNETRS